MSGTQEIQNWADLYFDIMVGGCCNVNLRPKIYLLLHDMLDTGLIADSRFVCYWK
jgi:hypothetical protein